MRPSRRKFIEKTIQYVGIDYVRFVNSNYEQLLNSYYGSDADDNNINFPTWCMVMYCEQISNPQVEVNI